MCLFRKMITVLLCAVQVGNIVIFGYNGLHCFTVILVTGSCNLQFLQCINKWLRILSVDFTLYEMFWHIKKFMRCSIIWLLTIDMFHVHFELWNILLNFFKHEWPVFSDTIMMPSDFTDHNDNSHFFITLSVLFQNSQMIIMINILMFIILNIYKK